MYKIVEKRHGMLVLERDEHKLRIEEKGCFEIVSFCELPKEKQEYLLDPWDAEEQERMEEGSYFVDGNGEVHSLSNYMSLGCFHRRGRTIHRMELKGFTEMDEDLQNEIDERPEEWGGLPENGLEGMVFQAVFKGCGWERIEEVEDPFCEWDGIEHCTYDSGYLVRMESSGDAVYLGYFY